jgi:hypothetical protein
VLLTEKVTGQLIPVKKERKKDANNMQSTGKRFFMSQLFCIRYRKETVA